MEPGWGLDSPFYKGLISNCPVFWVHSTGKSDSVFLYANLERVSKKRFPVKHNFKCYWYSVRAVLKWLQKGIWSMCDGKCANLLAAQSIEHSNMSYYQVFSFPLSLSHLFEFSRKLPKVSKSSNKLHGNYFCPDLQRLLFWSPNELSCLYFSNNVAP